MSDIAGFFSVDRDFDYREEGIARCSCRRTRIERSADRGKTGLSLFWIPTPDELDKIKKDVVFCHLMTSLVEEGDPVEYIRAFQQLGPPKFAEQIGEFFQAHGEVSLRTFLEKAKEIFNLPSSENESLFESDRKAIQAMGSRLNQGSLSQVTDKF